MLGMVWILKFSKLYFALNDPAIKQSFKYAFQRYIVCPKRMRVCKVMDLRSFVLTFAYSCARTLRERCMNYRRAVRGSRQLGWHAHGL